MSEHNEKIKHIYGNYNFWSWLRYWYIDSANYVTLLLLDKGYYDYDFEKAKAPEKPWEETRRSDEEVRNILVGFGFNHLAEKKPESLEDIQDHIINQIKED